MVLLQVQKEGDKTVSSARLLVHGSSQPDYAKERFTKDEAAILQEGFRLKQQVASLSLRAPFRFVQFAEQKEERSQLLETARRAGASLSNELKAKKIQEITLSTTGEEDVLLAYAEGLALGAYQFNRFKTAEDEKYELRKIGLVHKNINEEDIQQLQAVIEGTLIARDLVNTPVSHLNAEQLAQAAVEFGKIAGYKTEVCNGARIRSLKMGGLLSVNAGSIDPPTFSVLEWKPKKVNNKRPVILVGKGVVFDTGGLTLKPTPNSMDLMKSDMAGAAAVIGSMYAIAKASLPVHVIGLIPATDNRPGERATAPGDVITMYDGTTVEVLNTDAEGRLILADALAYAKKMKPELVIDVATLTGAAARAIGPLGIVMMGTAGKEVKQQIENSGNEVYERIVEFPFWNEFGEMIRSDIADLKNVSSGSAAGAITAGKFLEHFTDYPWIHMDIAGPAFNATADHYRVKNGTGVGVRLLFHFISNNF